MDTKEQYTPVRKHLDDSMVTVVCADPSKSYNLGKHPKCLWDTITVKDHNTKEPLALRFLCPGLSNDPREAAKLKIDTADFGGAFQGQLAFPKQMDITGLDVFLPDNIEESVYNQLLVQLRIGEGIYYTTPIRMMSAIHYGRHSDEFPSFVYLPSLQSVSVIITCDKLGVKWEGKRFGVRLRGVGYREVF